MIVKYILSYQLNKNHSRELYLFVRLTTLILTIWKCIYFKRNLEIINRYLIYHYLYNINNVKYEII